MTDLLSLYTAPGHPAIRPGREELDGRLDRWTEKVERRRAHTQKRRSTGLVTFVAVSSWVYDDIWISNLSPLCVRRINYRRVAEGLCHLNAKSECRRKAGLQYWKQSLFGYCGTTIYNFAGAKLSSEPIGRNLYYATVEMCRNRMCYSQAGMPVIIKCKRHMSCLASSCRMSPPAHLHLVGVFSVFDGESSDII